ncbi:MAG TPA: SDR family oxidoreductase [Candidatus Limnocylindria bacterium]|jgi:nucleoside-diphosphate-sugar epimerase|nr:SDR family oxidoreductase [Candidatus Limnocylindria bacterium]
MSAQRRVLVTGHRGYVGAVMAPAFREAGFDVVGMDVDFFRDCDLFPLADIPSIEKDIRDVEASDLEGFDAVVHLAALSNDPIGNLNEAWTADINVDGTVRLAEAAREAGVGRFLFSSSCIMYGMAEAGAVDEDSPLNPQTEYARSKVVAERALSARATPSFSPVYLRNGTIFGVSPRMRFDTVLNNLTGMAVTTGAITVMSDGTPWRPLVHVRDVARAFIAVVDAPVEAVHDQAFNLGADALNHQVRDLAHAVQRAVPEASLEIRAVPDADQRTYRTSFAKFARTFPTFRFERNADDGAVELTAAFRDLGLTYEAFTSDRFTRLKRLGRLIEDGSLDDALRWRIDEGMVA